MWSKSGCSWDRVYAEIRADLKVTRAIDMHILFHLKHRVHTKARLVDRVLEVMDRGDDLYVCPKTGQLRRFQPAR